MITFKRNTQYEVEVYGPANELNNYLEALIASEEVDSATRATNDNNAAVVYFGATNPIVSKLPPIGSVWTS